MKILSVICTSPGKWNSSGIATRKTDLDKKKTMLSYCSMATPPLYLQTSSNFLRL